MPKYLLCLLFACVLCTILGIAGGSRGIIYQSPVPGAVYVLPQAEICIRVSGPVGDDDLLQFKTISVTGSRSGKHSGDCVVSDDHQTLIFKPHTPFQAGETVDVRLPQGWVSKVSNVRRGSFQFTISSPLAQHPSAPSRYFSELSAEQEEFSPNKMAGGRTINTALDSLPIDFPYLGVSNFDSTSEGRLFISNFTFGPTSSTKPPYLLIVDNHGNPVFYRKMPSSCFDFKMQPNGLLTYFQLDVQRFYALDSSYAVVDSFSCGNGYKTDLHDLRILENGHALILSYDSERVDMRTVVAGGDSAASVAGLIIQELDRNKNVVFQWRSWDHFQITDATHENLLAHTIDYVHANAVELDTDGNLLISSRHMDEITKISRTTGEIIWRLGGKHNEFTFINDSIGFSHQHAIRRLANGNVTLFDNGNFHSPQFSRAVEYHLDETQKTAQLVWQYRDSPDVFGSAMGYAQRLENGNTLIGWGTGTTSVTEVRQDGTKVFELSFDTGIFSYRAYRFPWKPYSGAPATQNPESYVLSQNYPNPFNNSTNILVDVPYESSISLKIYDELGRKVQTIVDGIRKNKGEYFFSVDGSKLASGIYFYRLQGEGFSATRKMLLTK